jgi:hypothetical protein
MSTRRLLARVVSIVLLGSACVFGLFACGNGDDNSNVTPLVDSGTTFGTVGDGNVGILCLDGGFDAGDVTLTPYTACSPYTVSCIPFDPARVPIHPQL